MYQAVAVASKADAPLSKKKAAAPMAQATKDHVRPYGLNRLRKLRDANEMASALYFVPVSSPSFS
jgi:hypothetical protein